MRRNNNNTAGLPPELQNLYTGITGLDEKQISSREQTTGEAKIARVRNPFKARPLFGSREIPPGHKVWHDILRLYELDSYCRQAVDKYVELVGLGPYKYRSSAQECAEYIQWRLRIIEWQSGISFEELISQIARDLLLFGNSFLLKKRTRRPDPIPGARLRPVTGGTPIGGYFPLPPYKVRVRHEGREAGTIVYIVDGKEFNQADVIHFTLARFSGEIWGKPPLLPVVDDIRALRFLEEMFFRSIYQYVAPIVHVKVAPLYGQGPVPPGDIDTVRQIIESKGPDEWLITEARVDITQIEGQRALLSPDYLTEVTNRVFGGLGVSGIQMGRAVTGRATAVMLVAEMQYKVRYIRRIISSVVEREIFCELLKEANYQPLTNPDHFVTMEFPEIDTESQIAWNNHAVLLYTSGVLPLSRVVSLLGEPPLTEKEKEELYHRQVQIPLAIARRFGVDVYGQWEITLKIPEDDRGRGRQQTRAGRGRPGERPPTTPGAGQVQQQVMPQTPAGQRFAPRLEPGEATEEGKKPEEEENNG